MECATSLSQALFLKILFSAAGHCFVTRFEHVNQAGVASNSPITSMWQRAEFISRPPCEGMEENVEISRRPKRVCSSFKTPLADFRIQRLRLCSDSNLLTSSKNGRNLNIDTERHCSTECRSTTGRNGLSPTASGARGQISGNLSS